MLRSIVKRGISNLYLIVFALFVGAQAMIVSKVVLFGDDYYYTSFFHWGSDYFLSENVKHWLQTNGRAFVHLLDEVLLAGGAIWLWRIFSVTITALIAVFAALISSGAYKNGAKNESFKLSLIISCVCISFISISTANQTLYWATGYLNYVFPIFLTLALFYFTEKSVERGNFSVWFCPLAFFACATTEQNAFVSLCIIIFAALRMFFSKKRPNKAFIVAVFLAIIGFISLFAAPGNAVRKTYYADFYSLSVFERVINNIERIAKLIFETSGAARAIALFFVAAACISAEKLKGFSRVFLTFFNAVSAFLLVVFLKYGVLKEISVIFTFAVFALDIIWSITVFLKGKNYTVPFFIVMSAGVQAAMLISPEMGPRTVIASVIFLIIPTAFCVNISDRPIISCLMLSAAITFMTDVGWLISSLLIILLATIFVCAFLPRLKKTAPRIAVLILALLMLDMLAFNYAGYSENYTVHQENARLLSEYRERSSLEGEHVLEQKYLPNGTHKYTMPYDDPYHMYWFKVAMKLPLDTVINYK